jgi:non-canonical purine NTP pyrophosphatase (RdgB/HAM1 family)
MKKNIVFITSNENKQKEVEEILAQKEVEEILDIDKYTIIYINLDIPDIQSVSVEEVINAKINSAYELLKEDFKKIIQKFKKKGIEIKNINDVIVICENSGVYIKDMNDFPGSLFKFYVASVLNNGIVKMNGGSIARAETVIGIIKNGKIQNPLVGTTTGKIAEKIGSKDSKIFGWDPIFIPDLSETKYSEYDGKTYAELKKLDIKNKISQRRKAFDKLKKLLK